MTPSNYKNFWDNKATSYTGALIAVDGSSDESSVVATGARSANQVAAALDLKVSDRVLELGCGVARIGLPLAPRVGFWQGVDISQNMVDVAKQRLAGVANTAVEALTRPALPFPDASFDAVYSIAVFIHMDKEDFFIYLREIFRVLKPGGRVFFDHWNLAHPVGFKRFLYEANFYDKHGDVSVRKDVARNQFTTPQEVEVFIAQAGLSATEVMGDTCWVQALAVKGDAALVAAERARISAQRDQINYGQAWTQYFDWVLPVVFDGVAPAVILQRLLTEPQGEVRAMYETWLLAAWRNNPQQYGAAPEA
jgi:SAM-dependent methyltransferase